MSYLGLDLDSLCFEIKSLMENNYEEGVTDKNVELFFENAKRDILEDFEDTINQNKEDIIKEFQEELE